MRAVDALVVALNADATECKAGSHPPAGSKSAITTGPIAESKTTPRMGPFWLWHG